MKRDNIIAGIILLIIVMAAFTNPNPYRHKELLKSKLYTGLQESGTDKIPGTDESWGKTSEAIRKLLGTELINKLVENQISTKNYGLFSTSSINVDGKSKVIGIGIFGYVFYTSEFDESLKHGLLNSQE
jgi:Domain of unknown function (DUF4359)